MTARDLPSPLLQPVASQDVAAAVRSAIGADEALLSTPAGTVLVDAKVLGEHLAPERTAYLPLLKDALTNPHEVWQSFEQHKGTGKVVLRTRFVTVYQVRKGQAVMVVTSATHGVMSAWTLIGTSDMKYLNAQRAGQLLHIEGEALTP